MRLIVFAIALCMAAPAPGSEYERLRVAVHVDTAFSHNTRTVKIAGLPVWKIQGGDEPEPIESIARQAMAEGIDAIIVADRARGDITLRLTPFSRVFAATVSSGSVADVGGEAFLRDIHNASNGIIIVPGLEAIPHYKQKGTMLLHLYRHVVIAGLDAPEKIDSFPDTVGGLGWRFSWSILLNVPLLALLTGGWLAYRRTRRKWAGITAMCVSALFLIDGAPFLPREISAFDDSTLAAVNAITAYADSNGAVSILAHPDAQTKNAYGAITECTLPYTNLITDAGFTAFAAFADGKSALAAGKEWDAALIDFCRRKRATAVWAISECDYDAGSKPGSLAEAQTIVFAKERSAAGIIESIRSGRCYATRTSTYRKIEVADYSLTCGSQTAISGEMLAVEGTARLNLRLKILSGTAEKAAERVRVHVISDGRRTELPLEISGNTLAGTMTFDEPAGNFTYVRVVICDKIEPVIALNPIFIHGAGARE